MCGHTQNCCLQRQWLKNEGRCGVCGDPYDAPQPRENEAGGVYANGVIVRTYRQGQVIPVDVKITANHLGYFVFKLCPNNNVKKAVTHDCLDQHVLSFVGPSGEDLGQKFYIDSKVDTKHVRLQLPSDVTCTQCVLQWTYNTGNSWGCDSGPSGRCCIGCGHQENFVNCADIAITSGSEPKPATDSPTAPDTPRPATPGPKPTAKPSTEGGKQCRAGGVFAGRVTMDDWCRANCARHYCPSYYCSCS
ncbi:uncharacterized protein LOC143297847 [Babylonia areolata]|uniref:uncharacterized protein LOC143297847 n=1 Tax=Babylonia areolata TaxID=304850 RepID=UPI003FCF9B9B